VARLASIGSGTICLVALRPPIQNWDWPSGMAAAE